MGHSLDDAIDFFIEIVSGSNEILKMQITEQLKNGVLKGIRFSNMYNAVRYPFYKNHNYKVTEMSKNDCEQMIDIYSLLKKYIDSINIKI